MTKTRRPLEEMRTYAGWLVARLAPFCERLEIAGSIRRGRPDPADIELVAVPRHRPAACDLWGNVVATTDELHAHCERLRAAGEFADRRGVDGKGAFGPRYKRLLWTPLDAPGVAPVPVDLFCATPATFGLHFLLRTGPGEFNVRLVTARTTRLADGRPGWLPGTLRVHDGVLWDGARAIETPDEAACFRAMDLPWLEPEARTGTVRLLPRAEGGYRWAEPEEAA